MTLSEGEVLTVLAKAGKKGECISRYDDGRIILFSDVDPLTIKVKPGVVVECRVVKDAENYILVRPVEIKVDKPKEPHMLITTIDVDHAGNILVPAPDPNSDEIVDGLELFRNILSDFVKKRVKIYFIVEEV